MKEKAFLLNSNLEFVSTSIRTVFFDKQGDGWFGSETGVYHFKEEKFTHYHAEHGFTNEQVVDIIQDDQRNLWFGTKAGLYFKSEKDTEFVHVPIPFSDTTSSWLDKVYPVIDPNAVNSLLQDRKGFIWIGTCGAGAYRFDPNAQDENGGYSFTQYLQFGGAKQEDGLHHNWIEDITEDSEGNIWFASMTRGGATKYDGITFHNYMPEDGLCTDMVRTIFESKDGSIWFGFKGNIGDGVTQLKENTFRTYRKEDGLCDLQTFSIFEDDLGQIWFAGHLGNVCVFNEGVFQEFIHDDKTLNDILKITEDKKGRMWFAGSDGLWMLDGDKLTNFRKN